VGQWHNREGKTDAKVHHFLDIQVKSFKESLAGICLEFNNQFVLLIDKKTWVGRTSAQSWETLVVFAVGFKELKVIMNMGNVMGNVEWISKNLRLII